VKKQKKWAFILDKDEFVRLSLNKILNKYGFQVEEIEDFSQVESRKKDVKEGVILADVEVEVLERWFPLVRKWNDRFILMSPLVTDDLSARLKKMGVCHIIKKPVDPTLLRRMIREISFPDELKFSSLRKKKEKVPCSVRKEVKGYEEMDISLPCGGFGD
jgi:FixJ family two-component response regulator